MENNFKYASFKDRALALLIDVVFLTIASLILQGIIFGVANYMHASIDVDKLNFLDRLILGPVYYIVMLYFFEASLGKMIMKIKIVSESGRKMLFLQILLRETVGKAVSALTLGYGYFWIIVDNKNQGFHDKIAKTVVIYDK
jgi:uncharacterized RDD family membrane protein YckC